MTESAFIAKARAPLSVLSVILFIIGGFPGRILARSPGTRLTDPAELEAFMDGVVKAQLEAYNVVGATVAVVKDGALLYAKGYGYADLQQKKRVQADKTLFRIASVSKLFVWTAVMQLVEQGKLDLDTDINTYLTRFKIPDTYKEPVTLAHLMTHTAGFEDFVIRLFMKNKDRLLPLGDILAKELPARVRRPGDIASYSNHGTAIAAYIVEQVSGVPWNEYVEKNILRPLKMAHTTFRQPLPPELAANLSRGYTGSNGEFHAQPFVYVPLAPVAAASTTATDMANFMMAHLDHGRFGKDRILADETARQMHSALFRHAPEVNPMAHGFFDMSRNGQFVIGHSGNLLYFHSILALMPDHAVGLFISYNSRGGAKAIANTYELFLDRYFPPEKVQSPEPPVSTKIDLQRFTGRYFSSRRVHRRFTKLGALLGTINVTLSDDGLLKTSGRETRYWIMTHPLAFRQKNGLQTLAFREDDQGRITHMFMGDLPYAALERVRFRDSVILHAALAAAAILVFITTVVTWPYAAFIRRRHAVKATRRAQIPRPAYIAAWSASFLFIAVAAVLAAGLRDANAILFGIPVGIRVVMVLSVVSAIVTAGALVYAVVIWKSGRGSVWGRIYYSVVVLALISMTWQLSHWELLGLNF